MAGDETREALKDVLAICDSDVPPPLRLTRVARRAREGLLSAPDPSPCFRCGGSDHPGTLVLEDVKGRAEVPCPYCHPAKAVEWMLERVRTSPTGTREPERDTLPADLRDAVWEFESATMSASRDLATVGAKRAQDEARWALVAAILAALRRERESRHE